MERLRANQTGTGNREFKWKHVTELALEDPEINTLVAVTFQMNETIGHFVPVEMRELYGNRRRGSRVDGTAIYSRFRRFEVSTASGTDPKTPDSRN